MLPSLVHSWVVSRDFARDVIGPPAGGTGVAPRAGRSAIAEASHLSRRSILDERCLLIDAVAGERVRVMSP